MSAQNAIDLSKLPAPELISGLSFETIFAEIVADLQIDFPNWQPFESEITTKALQIGAYRILQEIQARNSAAIQNLIAYATGSNLDHLGANLLVSRLENETDENFRARIILAPEAFSTAGPNAAYVYHAKSASAEIADVRVSSPAPKEVVIAVLGKNPIIPTQEILDAVAAKCNSETVRPITDFVTVQAATPIDFEIAATITTYLGPDPDIVLANARASLDAHLANIRKIGHDVTKSMLIAALGVAGVQKVEITSPSNDVIISPTEVGRCLSINISAGGIGE